MTDKHYKGFTLAELLAVVIIVSLMATFSVGYYSKSKQQARFTEILNEANNSAEEINRNYVEQALQGYTFTSVDNFGDSVCDDKAHYCVKVSTDYAVGVPRGQIICIGNDAKGKAFCETMGYKNCTQDGMTYNCLK